MKIIDSKERVFCQCGSRALQQETRQRPSQPGFSQRRDQVLITADNAETLGGVATRPADTDSTRESDRLFPRGTFRRRLKLFRMTIQQDPFEPDRWWFAPLLYAGAALMIAAIVLA